MYPVKCALTNLPIYYFQEIAIIGLEKIKHWKKYTPITLPIYCRYDGYGNVEDIVKDDNVCLLETFFNLSIEDIVFYLVARSKINTVDEAKRLASLIETNKLHKLKNCEIAFVHKKGYELMTEEYPVNNHYNKKVYNTDKWKNLTMVDLAMEEPFFHIAENYRTKIWRDDIPDELCKAYMQGLLAFEQDFKKLLIVWDNLNNSGISWLPYDFTQLVSNKHYRESHHAILTAILALNKEFIADEIKSSIEWEEEELADLVECEENYELINATKQYIQELWQQHSQWATSTETTKP